MTPLKLIDYLGVEVKGSAWKAKGIFFLPQSIGEGDFCRAGDRYECRAIYNTSTKSREVINTPAIVQGHDVGSFFLLAFNGLHE